MWKSEARGSAFILALGLLAAPTLAREPLSDAQVRQAIIQDSIARYQATGHHARAPTTQPATGRGSAVGAPTAGPAARHLFASRRMSATGWLPIGGGRIRRGLDRGAAARAVTPVATMPAAVQLVPRKGIFVCTWANPCPLIDANLTRWFIRPRRLNVEGNSNGKSASRRRTTQAIATAHAGCRSSTTPYQPTLAIRRPYTVGRAALLVWP
jgi:hypothetical protein